MARRNHPATTVFATAVMLGMAAVANAAQEDGPRWPSIYEPQWPNIPGAPGYDPDKPAPVPARPEPALVTGSVPSPVARRWYDFKPAPAIVVVDLALRRPRGVGPESQSTLTNPA